MAYATGQGRAEAARGDAVGEFGPRPAGRASRARSGLSGAREAEAPAPLRPSLAAQAGGTTFLTLVQTDHLGRA
jgi:hypothetical protein